MEQENTLTIPRNTRIAALIMRITGIFILIILIVFAYHVFISRFYLPEPLDYFFGTLIRVFETLIIIWVNLIPYAFISKFSFLVNSLFLIVGSLFIWLSQSILRNKRRAWIYSIVLYLFLAVPKIPFLFFSLYSVIGMEFDLVDFIIIFSTEFPFIIFVLPPLLLLLSDKRFYWERSSSKILIRTIILGILSILIFMGLDFMFMPQGLGARDKRIIADIAQLRTLAEYTFGEEDFAYSRGLTCEESEALDEVMKFCNDIREAGETELVINLSPGREKYCAFAKLHTKENRRFVWQKGKDTYYCVDSAGIAGFTNTNPGNNTECPEDTSG